MPLSTTVTLTSALLGSDEVYIAWDGYFRVTEELS